MKTIKREGIDVGTAFSATSKRMQSARSVLPEDAHQASIPTDSQPTGQPVAEKSYINDVNFKAKIKRALRFIAKHGYRNLKPFIKPVAFRIRQYFVAGFSDQSANITRQQQTATDALFARMAALEYHVANIAAGQQLAATHISQLSDAVRQVPEVPEELLEQIKRIEDYTYASARRVAVNCGPDELMIRSEIGFVLCSASDHALIATLLEAGELEPGTRLLIQKILKPGDTYVDVGANIGMHMLAAAQAMQGSGKVIGFEPFGPTKALIDKTMWINGFSAITETHQLAVSSKSGSQSLNLGATSGHHSLFKLDTPAALAKPPVKVDLISLDEIIKPDQVVHLLKIDAEGAELDVIAGAKRLLKNNPQIKLIVELGLSHLERTGHTIEDWLEKFSALGFDYQVINAISGELETYSIEDLEATGTANLFFFKTKTADPLETKA
jgi:FkbM family methyltransferase